MLAQLSCFSQQLYDPGCEGCIPRFNPMPSEKYVLNAWVSVESAANGTISYGPNQPTGPQDIRIEVYAGGFLVGTAIPVGYLIDGWQLMECIFVMPAGENPISLLFISEAAVANFDDIKIAPADGSMKCYVYDPENLRFVAELDERHYATFYEYDNEGRLMRVKKETERGRMTIQETQNNVHHAP